MTHTLFKRVLPDKTRVIGISPKEIGLEQQFLSEICQKRKVKQLPEQTTISGISWQCCHCNQKFGNLSTLKAHMEKKCTKNIPEKTNAKNLAKTLLSKLPNIKAKIIGKETRIVRLPKKTKSKHSESILDVQARITKLPKTLKKAERRVTRSKTAGKQVKKCFWPCSKCPQIFSTEARLDAHLEKCAGISNLIKPKKKTSQLDTITLFEPYHFDRFRNVYICTKCLLEYNVRSEIEEHLKADHPSFACKLCERTFEFIVDLGYHSAEHDATSTMTCPCCDFKSRIKSKLAFHIQTVHSSNIDLVSAEDVTFTCVVCSKAFYNRRKLWHHQRNYHKATVEIEPSMGARLEQSLSRAPSNEPKVFLCDSCGKNFNSKYRLERHQRAMHQGLKPFVCRFCARAFTGKDTMQKHERIHTGEKPYSCEYCGKCFRQPGPFTVHQRIHTGERPYVCKFCKKGFITNQSRKSHSTHCVGREEEDIKYNDIKYNIRKTRASNAKKIFKEESEDELDLLSRLKLEEIPVDPEDVKQDRTPKKKKKRLLGIKTWKCELCQEVFLDTILWQRHKRQKDCTFEPLPDSNITVPRKRLYKNRTFTCKHCQETFTAVKLFKEHKKTHKGLVEEAEQEEPTYKFDQLQDLYICSVCSAEFQEESEAEEHIKTHKEIITCGQCNENFKSYFDLGLHSTVHDPEHKVHCPLCSYVSANPNSYSFKAHVNYVHLKRFPFYCMECGRGFKQYKTYQEHQNSHLGKKPYVCVVCQKGFTYQKYLQVHQVRNHQVGITGNKIENECRTCNRYFYKPEALKEHIEVCYKKKKKIKSATPAKAFLCDSCGQTFTEKAKLLEHLRVHKGDLPFVCSWCGKRFPVKAYLKTHERVHTGEKPYSCEFCGKRFGQHAPFRVHRRTHTGERPYVCDFCSKGFTTNQGLKLHKKNCPDNQVNKMLNSNPNPTQAKHKNAQYVPKGPEEHAIFGYF